MNTLQIKIAWEQTEHPFDAFGTVRTAPEFGDDGNSATPVVIWKEITLGDIVQKIMASAVAVSAYAQERNAASGLALFVAVAAILPLDINIIKHDEAAGKFLRAFKMDSDGDEYIDKNEIEEDEDIKSVIKYYKRTDVLRDEGERYYVNGYILNRAFIVKQ